MTAIDAFWTPNERTGFVPNGLPSTPTQLTTSELPTLRALGSMPPHLGDLRDDEVAEIVSHLPNGAELIPPSLTPEDCEAAIRAYVLLAAHLIHRPLFASKRELPAVVARPLWALSEYVGRPPSLTYASYVLANFTTSFGYCCPTEELTIAQTPSGTKDEEWFVAVHLSVESAGGHVVKAISTIHDALDSGCEPAIVDALHSVASSMVFAESTMPTVRTRLDPVTFRERIRPLLYGHGYITFRGVPGEPSVMYIGETGAQSGIIRAVDAVLGTGHSQPMLSSMNRFLECAPRVHQRYFQLAIHVGEQLAQLTSPRVREARRDALLALAHFRRTHLSVVTDYLVPEGRSLATHGTGGTEFQVWLKQLIEEAEASADLT